MTEHKSEQALQFPVDRRQFLILSAAGASSLVLGIYPEQTMAANTRADKLQPVAWIEIHRDNRLVFHMSKSEMGQGVTTALAMLVAEELHVAVDQLTVEQAGYAPKYGNQSTGGSSSVSSNWQRLREAGAITRELFVAAASHYWKLTPGDCQAKAGKVHNLKTGASIAYGELIGIAQTLPLPKQVALKTRDFTIIGTSPPRIDLPGKVNGQARYGADIDLDKLLTATVVHCPYFGGRLASFEAKDALAVAGVRRIFKIHSGIAIVADNYWAADEGRKQLKINWHRPAEKILAASSYRELLDKDGIVVERSGTPPVTSGTNTIEAVYELPYQAHATMEPMSCTAYAHDGQIKVWAPTQNPGQAFNAAEKYGSSDSSGFFDKVWNKLLHTQHHDIHIEVTQLGGGFGRRLQQDYVAEAVHIAKTIGQPVRLMWSREEDIQHDFYRPATTHRITARLRTDGSIASWQHKLVGNSINEYLWPGSTGKGGDHSMTEGATRLPYSMTHRRVEYVKLTSAIPVGFWRSVGHSHNAFVKESFIDELAHATKLDPLQYRKQLLKPQPELLAVLQLAADKAGWGKPLAPDHYLGIALHSSYGSHVAEVAEISIADEQQIRVHKVTCAIDCGTVVNPDGVRAQVESAIVFGLTAALKSAITIEDGRVQQSNFHDFPLLTMQETPQVDTYIVPSTRPPAGVGEPGVPPIAPAVANAVFAATGQRLRQLPLRLKV